MDYEYLPGIVKAKARSGFHQQWGVAILVTLFGLLFSVPNQIISIMGNVTEKPVEFASVLGKNLVDNIVKFYNKNYMVLLIVSVAISLFLVIIKYGECKLYVDIVEKKDAGFSTIFDGLLYPIKAVVANIYIVVLVILWTMLFIIPGLVAAIKYSMTSYIIAEDPDIPITDAVDMSKNMMNGHKLDYVMLIFSFIPWILVIMLTFGLATVYVTPYLNASCAQFYVMVRDEYNARNGLEIKDNDFMK